MKRRQRRRIRWLRRAVAGLAGMAVMLGAPHAAAQQESDQVRVVAVDSSSHPQVTLTVEPPADLAGEELTAAAFRVLENGVPVEVRVARVDSVEAPVTNVPTLEVVLVIDTSGSMAGEPMEAAKQAAAAFLAQMPEGTRIAVVGFGDTPYVVSPMGDAAEAAAAGVVTLEARGETALYDALHVAVQQFGESEQLRQALVVLSDGGDTVSAATLDSAVRLLADSGVDFAAVELVTPEYDGTALRALASAEGRILSADSPGELVSSYEAVASDLLNRYAVTYTTLQGGVTRVELTLEWAGISATTARDLRLPALAAAAPQAAPSETMAPDPGWLGTDAARFTGFGLLFLMLAGLLSWTFLRERDTHVSLADRFGARSSLRLPTLSGWKDRASDAAQRRLERSGRESALYASLERAGIDLRPGEFLVVAAGATMLVLFLGFIASNPLVALALAGATAFAFRAVVQMKAKRRCARFAEQLADSLQLITGSLRAGHSILQSMDSVATDAPSPTKDEFQRLVMETRLGRDLPDALRAMHERVGNEDFEWFVQALEIHREVGGDLAEILDTVATTIRERTKLRRHVRTLSAEGRLSAVILFILPIAVAGLVSIMSPGYMAELFRGVGLALLMAAGVLMTAGFFWLRKMIRLDF